MDDIARAAGVARQTVYAHFQSREALIRAVQVHALERTLAVLDAAELDVGPAEAALERLVDLSWRTADEYRIFNLPSVPTSPEDSYEGHRPLYERLEPLITRGQSDGVFDRRLSPNWLLAVFFSLAHAAGDEVRSGRMSNDDAFQALKRSIWRIYGIDR
jgi:AcrR family transcriptional regulator